MSFVSILAAGGAFLATFLVSALWGVYERDYWTLDYFATQVAVIVIVAILVIAHSREATP